MVDWVFKIWGASSFIEGCIKGYMVETASFKWTRLTSRIWSASTVTSTFTCSFPRVRLALYLPGMYVLAEGSALFFRTEHNKAQDEKKDGQTYENGSVDHFFHPQHYDFCLGAHDQDLW